MVITELRFHICFDQGTRTMILNIFQYLCKLEINFDRHYFYKFFINTEKAVDRSFDKHGDRIGQIGLCK